MMRNSRCQSISLFTSSTGRKSDRALAATHHQQSQFISAFPECIPHCAIRQIKRQHQPAPAHRGDDRMFFAKCFNSVRELLALHPRVLHQLFLFDDSQVMRRADVIREVAAPGRADAARQPKTLSFTSSNRGPAMTPHTCAFLPNTKRSGSTPKCSQHQFLPVMPMPHCTSSKISRTSFSSQIAATFAKTRRENDCRRLRPGSAR